MKVVNIDFGNKTFTTDDGTEYPFMFDVNPSITIQKFQTLVDALLAIFGGKYKRKINN